MQREILEGMVECERGRGSRHQDVDWESEYEDLIRPTQCKNQCSRPSDTIWHHMMTYNIIDIQIPVSSHYSRGYKQSNQKLYV